MHCAAPETDHTPGRLRQGLCERHYRRKRTTGSTAPPKRMPTLARYRIDDATGCHVYTGPLYPNGYGKLAREVHGTRLAHLAAFREFYPDAPAGTEPDHTCRNRACIRREHLDPVTRSVNVQRAYERTGTCRNGLHPYVPGGCAPCRIANARRTTIRRRRR